MGATNAVVLLVSFGLIVYLFAAMLWPERF